MLTYTTPPLEADVEVIGEVSAEIWFSSSLRYADVFVRLCDVDEARQVVERLRRPDERHRAPTAPGAVDVQLWSTAHRFRRGHRIRVQVSSGAFPRYARNAGTGEPRATATRLLAADQVRVPRCGPPVRDHPAGAGRSLVGCPWGCFRELL